MPCLYCGTEHVFGDTVCTDCYAHMREEYECDFCNGSGEDPDSDAPYCLHCHGTGWVKNQD